jgi:hypothetical protein
MLLDPVNSQQRAYYSSLSPLLSFSVSISHSKEINSNMAPSFGSNNSRLSQIEQVAKYAQALAQTDSKGGRTVVTPSENLAILYDCPCWDDAYSEALICRFPRCRISIRDAQVCFSFFMQTVCV